MTKNKDEEKGLTTYNDQWAKENMRLGMSGVDPMDIVPPQVLLVQKSSDVELMQTAQGEQPKLGQFFHTGRNKIMASFEAYFIFAGKGTYVNRRKKGEPVEDQYVCVGYMVEDMSIFGYKFRSSALRSLSPLFTAVVAQNKPMFIFRCTVTSKMLENKDGKWWIPVVRVGEIETNGERIAELEFYAHQYEDKRERKIVEVEEDAPPVKDPAEDTATPPPDGKEDVNPSDIPF